MGGRSRRFGRDKADEVVDGRSLLQHVANAVSPLAREVIVVAAPGHAFRPIDSALPLKHVEDVARAVPWVVCNGLLAASNAWSCALACDMPLLSLTRLRHLHDPGCADEWDVVMPRWEGREEPLHAFHRQTCIPAIEPVAECRRETLRRFPAGVASAPR